MDVKDWMREALATGAFAAVDDVTAAELATAARVALRLGKGQAQQRKDWATEVLAEPRPPRRPQRHLRRRSQISSATSAVV